jgi:hypothetical protein
VAALQYNYVHMFEIFVLVFCGRIWTQVGTAPEDTLSKTQTSKQEEEEEEEEEEEDKN